MKTKEYEIKARSILSNPFASEKAWLAASRVLGDADSRVISQRVEACQKSSFAEGRAGMAAGMFLTVLVVTPNTYCLSLLMYFVVLLSAAIYLVGSGADSGQRTGEQLRELLPSLLTPNFVIGLGLAMTVTLLFMTIFACLCPHGWL